MAKELVAAFEEPEDVVMRYAWEVRLLRSCDIQDKF